MKKITSLVLFLLLALALVPASAPAQQTLDGSVYMVEGAGVPIFFNFSISGGNFLAIILTFGSGGNGRWFAAFGPTDGTSGTGQVLNPSSSNLTQPAGATLQFQLDQPDGPAGSFTVTGLSAFLSRTSGRIVRIFP